MGGVLPGQDASVSKTALLVVDMLNAYDHPDAEKLTRSVEKVLPTIAELIDDSELTVYVNDNFGSWTSNRDDLLRTALEGRFGHLVEPVAPNDDALFVVKARHSIFYQTPLEYLLDQEGVERIVLTGQVTEQCILYSALDAYIRHIDVRVPSDAVAHIHEDLADAALKMMEINMSADVSPARDRG
jgi:nicotinamidase-related amidase